jgi:basic membrane lipoprotein Med (substrate-binding protein (PBP1-ABC) superfamily)
MTRKRWLLACAGIVLLAGIGVFAWLSTSDGVPPPRAVVYTDFQACLLTGPQGLTDPTAATVWSGMQDASTATRAKVSYLAPTGPDTTGTVSPYVATLVQRKCNIVLTTDTTAADAITQAAAQHTDVRFVTVNGSAGSGKVTTIPPDSAAISRLIQEAIAHS